MDWLVKMPPTAKWLLKPVNLSNCAKAKLLNGIPSCAMVRSSVVNLVGFAKFDPGADFYFFSGIKSFGLSVTSTRHAWHQPGQPRPAGSARLAQTEPGAS